MLSTTCAMIAAKRFFACALETAGQGPETVITDRHDDDPRALGETRGLAVHQSFPLLGVRSCAAGASCCTVSDERRTARRPRTHVTNRLARAAQCFLFQDRRVAGVRCFRIGSREPRMVFSCPSVPPAFLGSAT